MMTILMRIKSENKLQHIFGLCTFLDNNIGVVLNALEETDFKNNTNIIYTSDHGDALGMREVCGEKHNV